jgi:hypothetical protein
VQVIRSALRMLSRRENHAFVILQRGELRTETGLMIIATFRSPYEVDIEENCAQLGGEIFTEIAFIAKSHAPEGTIRAEFFDTPCGRSHIKTPTAVSKASVNLPPSEHRLCERSERPV